MKYIDLHRHLEGAVRPQTIFELLNPDIDYNSFKRTMQVDGTEKTLMDFILKLGTKYMKQVVQSKTELERFGYEAVEDAFAENVGYLELRACPLPIHQTVTDISTRDYIKAVREGMLNAEQDFDIKTNLIISVKREDSPTENDSLVEEIIDAYKDGLVCGADLCGNEPAYPTRDYQCLFDKLAHKEIPITIHAGEAATSQSIWEALDLGAKRIGHATNLFQDEDLIEEIRKREVGLECCLTSNLHTRAIEDLGHHPLKKYFENGLLATFNTDDPITSDITYLTEEQNMRTKLFFTEYDIAQMTKNAIKLSFLSNDEKTDLEKRLLF